MAGLSQSFLDQLSRISESTPPSDEPTDISTAEQKALEKEKAKYYRKSHKAHLKNFKQDMRMRREYADRIYNMLAFWLMFTGGTVFMVALNKLSLTENIIIALLTTSSANVIAIFIYVVKYLYAEPARISDDNHKSLIN